MPASGKTYDTDTDTNQQSEQDDEGQINSSQKKPVNFEKA
jgi:hypothetical protein